MARRCAELFVLQNGYTDLPAAEDSTRWVLENGEMGSWPRVLAARGGMLEREARSRAVQHATVHRVLPGAARACSSAPTVRSP